MQKRAKCERRRRAVAVDGFESKDRMRNDDNRRGGYALSHGQWRTRLINEARIEIDSNVVERAQPEGVPVACADTINRHNTGD